MDSWRRPIRFPGREWNLNGKAGKGKFKHGQSDAYFRILVLQPQMKDVYRLGNHLVWMGPGERTPLSYPARAQQVRSARSEMAGQASCSGWFGCY